jgi:geranyl-CoA carboxylase beta subunit
MSGFESRWNARSTVAQQRRAAMLERLATLRALEQRAAHASAKSRPVFERRGQLLPRERVALLLDPGSPWLALCSLAGFAQDHKDPALSVPGGGVVAGIGYVSGVRCMVLASDSGIDAGAIQPMGLDKILRVQEIALQNKLPFLHLVESAGANLMRYRVEGFVHGGALFRNLARLSAAGIPVITVQHGSGTAGGAYMPGLSDVVIMVRGRSRAFLAGPPLLMAATGETATEEELGGAEMHTAVSGLGEYLAQDDRHALGIAREVVARLGWRQALTPTLSQGERGASTLAAAAGPLLPLTLGEGRGEGFPLPRFPADELLGLMPAQHREPVDMREIIARLVDDSDLLEFKALYGAATVCAQAVVGGHAVGFISNNGPIDVAGANKATHFIQWMCQLGRPLIYLQNTTGYMVGKDSEQAA